MVFLRTKSTPPCFCSSLFNLPSPSLCLSYLPHCTFVYSPTSLALSLILTIPLLFKISLQVYLQREWCAIRIDTPQDFVLLPARMVCSQRITLHKSCLPFPRVPAPLSALPLLAPFSLNPSLHHFPLGALVFMCGHMMVLRNVYFVVTYCVLLIKEMRRAVAVDVLSTTFLL